MANGGQGISNVQEFNFYVHGVLFVLYLHFPFFFSTLVTCALFKQISLISTVYRV